MTSEQFGNLALQMLAQSQIPGDALDTALQFRAMAEALSRGEAAVVPQINSTDSGAT